MENKCSENAERGIYQVSLLQSLLYGDYQGSITVGELKTHGNAGIGTFHRLNGELIMLEGEVYRAAADGRIERVSDGETVPFAVAAHLDAGDVEVLREIPDYAALCESLDGLVEKKGRNRFYMARIDGTLRQVSVRSVRAQKEPYLPLTEVMQRDQTFFDYENIEGTLVGVYCPPYMAGANAVGWHLHFISKDKTRGGHVLGVTIADASVILSGYSAYQLRLPQNGPFDRFDFTVDQTADVKKIETK